MPLDLAAVNSLLEVRPETTIDGDQADAQQVGNRLNAMWPAGEPVVYIGLAGTSTHQRVGQFYETAIGARGPHAGGWPVQMLDTARLWVHYGPADAPAVAEAAMVDRFVEGLAGDVRRSLIDPATPVPFANLTFPTGRRKIHGFRGVKAPRNVSESRGGPTGTEGAAVVTGFGRTQGLTDADLAAGQIRIPRESKQLFPESKFEIKVELGGEMYPASWDPREGGDKERSGVIRVGREVLTRHMSASGSRIVEDTGRGYRFL
ncbi:hypothetical protein E3O47_13255 [Cryobacterium sp. TMT2-17-1]|uniref:hypothetical protein n=1 Tax=unclassified Cryobacterium TaxID=2649013 RepID=UPI00106ACEB0|nr:MULTISPECIES: hypothetical protein [unclassified Cryobacterium]TFB59990.1 hypothetical protein E3N94_03155 [Cryobacterium sp. Sr3]TFC48612.1 hypothetical protein E3O47_13255 [Cryobacterium sp. TMT2-17-1]